MSYGSSIDLVYMNTKINSWYEYRNVATTTFKVYDIVSVDKGDYFSLSIKQGEKQVYWNAYLKLGYVYQVNARFEKFINTGVDEKGEFKI